MKKLAVPAVVALLAFGLIAITSRPRRAEPVDPATIPAERVSAAGRSEPAVSPPSEAEGPAGTVGGTVVYRSDSERPWRYARYYVPRRGAGHLAEAVVALAGPKLEAGSHATDPSSAVVDQKDHQFVPETLAIRAGDTVRFLNSDQEIHNVRTVDGAQPFNVSLPPGGEWSQVFRRPGGLSEPVRLGCAFHGAMRAWIYVFDHPHFQLTSGDGRFHFTGVPAGEYHLQVVHPAGQLRSSQSIRVEGGQATHAEIVVSPDDRYEEKKPPR